MTADPDFSARVNAADVIKILSDQIGNMSREMAIWQARALQVEARLNAMEDQNKPSTDMVHRKSA